MTGGIIQCYGAGLSIFKVFRASGLSGFYTCRALGSMGLGSRSRAEGPAQKIKQGRHRLVRSKVQGALGSSAKYTPIVNGLLSPDVKTRSWELEGLSTGLYALLFCGLLKVGYSPVIHIEFPQPRT